MNIVTKDDIGMVTAADMRACLDIENNPKLFSDLTLDIENREPAMFQWATRVRLGEVEKIGTAFENIFSAYPTLPIYLNGLLTHSFCRGYMMATSKWRPAMNGEVTKEHTYMPTSKDFE